MNDRRYINSMVALLSTVVGVVSFEMFGINYLMPLIGSDLHITNSQVGIIASAYWTAFAASCYGVGTMGGRLRKRKAILISLIVIFAFTAPLSGLSVSFRSLLWCRLLMGFVEGPVVPLIQSVVATESPAAKRGLNMGIVQNLGGSLLGSFAAPIILVWMAGRLSWRFGFFLVSFPAVLCVIALVFLLRDPDAKPLGVKDRGGEGSEDGIDLRHILSIRNVRLCAAAAWFAFAYIAIGMAFLPLYYVKERNFTPGQMSFLISILGISGLVLGILLPALSDKWGRKPVVIGASAFGMVCPLIQVIIPISGITLAATIFVGWAVVGASTLFYATIPAESVAPQAASTAIGIILAIGTLGGGFTGPAAAGWVADHLGLTSTLVLLSSCALAIMLISLLLRESRTVASSENSG